MLISREREGALALLLSLIVLPPCLWWKRSSSPISRVGESYLSLKSFTLDQCYIGYPPLSQLVSITIRSYAIQ